MILGLTLLWRGLEWYDGYLRRISTSPRVAAAPRPSPPAAPPPPVPTPEPAPPPTAEEIAALAASEEGAQWDAVNVLLRRQMTPELAAAAAAARPASPTNAERLACLRARGPGADAITAAVEGLGKLDAIWPGDVGHALCLIEALAARATDDPDRIRDALIPYAMSYPARLRRAAIAGLEKVPLREMSPKLREASEWAVSASLPVYAALALGLDEETAPELVEQWLESPEPSARSAISGHLARSPKRSAAVFIANRLVRDPGNAGLVRLARARDPKPNDVALALAEIALDEARPLHERQAALERLATLGEAAVVPRIEPLRGAADPALRSYAEAALAALGSGGPTR